MATKKYALFLIKFPSLLEDWSRQQKEQYEEERKKQQDKKQKDKGKPGSQKEFARQVGVPAYYVSDWKSGRSGTPYKYMKKICHVLGVDPEVFEPTTHAEKYEKSRAFITRIGRNNVEFAKERGLDLDLVRALSRAVGFDDLLPLYLPIPDREDCILPNKRPLADSAFIIDSSLDFLQVNRNGETITLHVCDLAFLKEVQDQVVDFVSYLFYKRSKEMSKETQDANKEIQDLSDKLTGGQRTLAIMEIFKRHDRFWGVFNDWEKANTKKATQEDWDRLWGEDTKLDNGGAATTKEGE